MPLGTTPDNANSGPRGEAKFHLFVETLLRFGEGKLAVTGASMLPAVWPGDVLEVRRQEAAGVRPGDVVLFRREGRLVAHRVVEQLEPAGRQGADHARRSAPRPPTCPLPRKNCWAASPPSGAATAASSTPHPGATRGGVDTQPLGGAHARGAADCRLSIDDW